MPRGAGDERGAGPNPGSRRSWSTWRPRISCGSRPRSARAVAASTSTWHRRMFRATGSRGSVRTVGDGVDPSWSGREVIGAHRRARWLAEQGRRPRGRVVGGAGRSRSGGGGAASRRGHRAGPLRGHPDLPRRRLAGGRRERLPRHVSVQLAHARGVRVVAIARAADRAGTRRGDGRPRQARDRPDVPAHPGRRRALGPSRAAPSSERRCSSSDRPIPRSRGHEIILGVTTGRLGIRWGDVEARRA